jgi:DNA polymerase-3 subunit beta
MLIPLKAIGELRRLADDARAEQGKDAVVVIAQSGPNAFFQLGGVRFGVKLVDAQFPPYSQVIPQRSERLLRVPRAPFADALKAVSLAASDKYRLAFVPGASYSPSTGLLKARDLSAASDAEVSSTTDLSGTTWVLELVGT